jgi:hypothetical protein
MEDLRRGNDGKDGGIGNLPDPLEHLPDLPFLDGKLFPR